MSSLCLSSETEESESIKLKMYQLVQGSQIELVVTGTIQTHKQLNWQQLNLSDNAKLIDKKHKVI